MTAAVQDATAAPAPGGPRPDPASDSRFTWGLVLDVFAVLERHGYRRGGNGAVGRAFGLLYPLTHAYEGTDADDDHGEENES
jgi:hypothetical protein